MQWSMVPFRPNRRKIEEEGVRRYVETAESTL